MRRSVTFILLCLVLALPARAETRLDERAVLELLGRALERDLDRGGRRDRDRADRIRRHGRPTLYRDRIDWHRRDRSFGIGPPPVNNLYGDRFRTHRPALRVAPGHCARSYRSDWGWRTGYGARCLWNSVPRPELLPDDCLRRVRGPHGPRHLYSATCLRHGGWTAPRRH